MNDQDGLVDRRALARTYDGGAYEDGWAAVLDYQAVMRYASEHPTKGSYAVSSALEIPRSRIRPWIDGDSRPDAVRALEAAEKYGWLEAPTVIRSSSFSIRSPRTSFPADRSLPRTTSRRSH